MRCSGSLRAVDAAETLAIARELAPALGVTRVTEITRLDRIGLPVFVSIRPDAERGSVCVNAGKGLRAIDAEVGATMESIELAWAEHRRCRDTLAIGRARAGELTGLPGAGRIGILDHGPVWGTPIDLDAEIATVVAEDVATGARVAVPAEAVIHPLPGELGGARYFGTSSNGLASGNTLAEATLHALAEVIERDVVSFHLLAERIPAVARAVRIAPETLPDPIRELADRLEPRGFRLVVCWLPNPYGLPAFSSVIYDRQQPELAAPGDGLHPVREIALIRAVTESAQARLAFIHGGRDDLADVYRRYAHLGVAAKAASFERQLAALARGDAIDYREVPDRAAACGDLASALALLVEEVRRAAGARVLRAVYTPASYPVTVARVVVPGLEICSRDTSRIGPRLLGALGDREAIDSPVTIP